MLQEHFIGTGRLSTCTCWPLRLVFHRRMGITLFNLQAHMRACAPAQAPAHSRVLTLKNHAFARSFRHNPFVNGDPPVRFYCGTPLVASNGHRLGTLCFADPQPHAFDAERCSILNNMAELCAREIERHSALRAAAQRSLQVDEVRVGGVPSCCLPFASCSLLLWFHPPCSVLHAYCSKPWEAGAATDLALRSLQGMQTVLRGKEQNGIMRWRSLNGRRALGRACAGAGGHEARAGGVPGGHHDGGLRRAALARAARQLRLHQPVRCACVFSPASRVCVGFSSRICHVLQGFRVVHLSIHGGCAGQAAYCILRWW